MLEPGPIVYTHKKDVDKDSTAFPQINPEHTSDQKMKSRTEELEKKAEENSSDLVFGLSLIHI